MKDTRHYLIYFNGFAKTKRAWGIFYFLSEYARTILRAINPACIQRLGLAVNQCVAPAALVVSKPMLAPVNLVFCL